MSKTRRHEFLERTIANTGELLKNEHVIRWLGHDAAWDLDRINDSVFIPNVRHGKLRIPKEYLDTDKVPITAISVSRMRPRGPRVTLPGEAAGMTLMQQAKAMMALQHQGYKDSVSGPLISANRRIVKAGAYIHLDKTSSAATVTADCTVKFPPEKFEDGSNYRITLMGRPMVALACYGRRPAASEATVVHEYTHVAQRLAGILFQGAGIPPRTAELELRKDRECEAYTAGARVAQAICTEGLRPDPYRYHSQIAGWYNLIPQWYPELQELTPFDSAPQRPEGL